MSKQVSLLLACLLISGCVPTASVHPGEGHGSSAASGRETALRELEQQIEDAVSRRDVTFLDRVTAPTFTRTDQEGKVEDRATVMALIRQPPPTSDIIRRTIDRARQQVQLHGDVAVTRGDFEVRGPRRAFRTTYSRVYRWRKGQWQLLSNTTLSTTPLTP
jgi:hypothetical protein